jgi:hypothetical protein
MSWVKTVRVDKQNWWRAPPTLTNRFKQTRNHMKTLKKLALAALMLITAISAQAEWVSGYVRNNGTYVAPYYRSGGGSLGRASSYGYTSGHSSGYVYRNPYAAYPSVRVRGYYRSNGTYVWPHVRTAPNGTVTDNLSYRGYGTIRVPRYSYGR